MFADHQGSFITDIVASLVTVSGTDAQSREVLEAPGNNLSAGIGDPTVSHPQLSQHWQPLAQQLYSLISDLLIIT